MTTRKPGIDPDTTIEEVDLDIEEVYYHGERLTEARAAQIGAETVAEARRRNLIPGRKSLSGDGTHSPLISTRVPAQLHREIRDRAAAEHTSVSKLVRRLIEEGLHRDAA